MTPKKIAIVGATGAVGQVLLRVLGERSFPIADLIPFASKQSIGKPVSVAGRSFKCRELAPGCFQGVDLVFFDVSDEISKTWVPLAVRDGAWVIDNSAVYRLDSKTPLIVPEVNGQEVKKQIRRLTKSRILSGPNCTTAQLVMALKPIADRWGLKRVVVSTYQSTSGAGSSAMEELKTQARDLLEGRSSVAQQFKHPIAFNVIPQIGSFKEGGYTSEEIKVIEETRKILGIPKLAVTCTAVRVPTLLGHGESVNIETKKTFKIKDVVQALRKFPGVEIHDNPTEFVYPMPKGKGGMGAENRDPVLVGRIRKDSSVKNGIHLWIVADNLRKGAALNAVQIGELLGEVLG